MCDSFGNLPTNWTKQAPKTQTDEVVVRIGGCLGPQNPRATVGGCFDAKVT